uniref:Uncharacterized protein n=1 Tax=Streptomyces sp. NRRL 30471 TaxID=996287 RepID=F2WUF0_9ACTN|nr:hypothetical protein [Streptomyces sp. NRRL 30471]
MPCPGAVTHENARYGRVIALAQQPTVEFHLDIDQSGRPLGEPGRCFGSQTEWWDIPPGRAIGAGRRSDVEDSLKKTEKHTPGKWDDVRDTATATSPASKQPSTMRSPRRWAPWPSRP